MESPERILVIGGQDFLGSWITRALLEDGIPFLLFDRRPDNSVLSQIVDPEILPQVRRAFGDTADAQAIGRMVREHGISRIIHLGTSGDGAAARKPEEAPVPAARGLRSAFEAIRASAGAVRLIAYAASDRTEQDARGFHRDHGIPSVGLRPADAYGVGCGTGPAASLTRAIQAAVLGRRFTIPFCGTACLAYAGDRARIFLAAALSGTDSAPSILPPAEAIAIEGFIRRIEDIVPEAAGRISCAGEDLSLEPVLEEAGIEDLPGAPPVRLTPLAEGIFRTAELFRRLADAGRMVLDPD